jgi:hypothetical protein
VINLKIYCDELYSWYRNIAIALFGLQKKAAMAINRFEAFRKWFSPHKKLWAGIGLF